MMMMSQTLLLLLLLSPTIILAWVCNPPTHLLPTRFDCLILINGLDELSRNPIENQLKRWSRHLPSTAHTEQLPKWFYVVAPGDPPTTCAIEVDAADAYDVDTFSLSDIVQASKTVCIECLGRRKQLGLEFPTEGGHSYVKLVRYAGEQRGERLRLIADGNET